MRSAEAGSWPIVSHKRLSAELLVVGVTSPLKVGVYVDGRLVESFVREEKSSKALPPILHEVCYRYDLKALYYARGPGSFMAIKVVYVMLKTFAIVRDLPLYAADAFVFNGDRPIKAVGRSCFVKKEGAIVVEKGCDTPLGNDFELPKTLDPALFGEESEPLYVLPAV